MFSIVDIAGINKLPKFDYDQDEELVNVNIHLSNAQVEDISLGFNSRKVSHVIL